IADRAGHRLAVQIDEDAVGGTGGRIVLAAGPRRLDDDAVIPAGAVVRRDDALDRDRLSVEGRHVLGALHLGDRRDGGLFGLLRLLRLLGDGAAGVLRRDLSRKAEVDAVVVRVDAAGAVQGPHVLV